VGGCGGKECADTREKAASLSAIGGRKEKDFSLPANGPGLHGRTLRGPRLREGGERHGASHFEPSFPIFQVPKEKPKSSGRLRAKRAVEASKVSVPQGKEKIRFRHSERVKRP